MAFLGITVPLEVCRILSKLDVPGKKEPQLEYHVTLFYFGENWDIENVLKLINVLHKKLVKQKIFQVKTKKITCFDTPEGKPTPIIAKVLSEDLIDLRKRIAKILDKEKIQYSKNFEFTPHITLSYADNKIKDTRIDEIDFTVDKLTLWTGDKNHQRLCVDFLLDPETKKVANLITQVDLFCTMNNQT